MVSVWTLRMWRRTVHRGSTDAKAAPRRNSLADFFREAVKLAFASNSSTEYSWNQPAREMMYVKTFFGCFFFFAGPFVTLKIKVLRCTHLSLYWPMRLTFLICLIQNSISSPFPFWPYVINTCVIQCHIILAIFYISVKS